MQKPESESPCEESLEKDLKSNIENNLKVTPNEDNQDNDEKWSFNTFICGNFDYIKAAIKLMTRAKF